MAEKKGFLGVYKKEYLLYGFTNTVSTMWSQMKSNYSQFFLNSVVVLPALMAANISTISSTIGWICTLFLGVIMQKANPKMGRFRFFMILGSFMSAIAGIMMFFPITIEKYSPSFVYVWFIVATVLTVGYDVFYTPYTGCIALIAPDPSDRASLSGVRAQLNSIGKLIWSFFNVAVIAALGKMLNSEIAGYTAMAAILGVLLICITFFTGNLVKGKEKPDEVNEKTGRANTVPILTMIKLIFQRPILCMIVGQLAKTVCYAMIYGVMAYYYTYVAGDKSGLTVYLSASTFIMLIGGFCAPFISKTIGARMTCILGYLIYIATLLLSYFIGKTANVFTILMAVGIFGYQIVGATDPAMTANAVDYSYYKTGINANAFLFQMVMMTAPLGQLIKTAALGYGLAYFGFDATNMTARAIEGIRILTAFVPTVFLVFGVIAYILYPLNEQKVKEAKEAFEAKQAKAE